MSSLIWTPAAVSRERPSTRALAWSRPAVVGHLLAGRRSAASRLDSEDRRTGGGSRRPRTVSLRNQCGDADGMPPPALSALHTVPLWRAVPGRLAIPTRWLHRRRVLRVGSHRRRDRGDGVSPPVVFLRRARRTVAVERGRAHGLQRRVQN